MGGSLYLFRIADIPVHVSFWYGLLLLWWFRGGDWQTNLVWAGVITVSILIHELGHAFVARHYRLRPRILLHGLGGLCAHDRADRDRHDVFIIAAGPGAGLLLGLATLVVSLLAGPALLASGNVYAVYAIEASLWVNIGWSLVNLLPIWPLDGGQLFRIGMVRAIGPKNGERVTHVVALTLLAAAGIVGFLFTSGGLLILLLLWVGMANVQALTGNRASGPIRSVNKHSKHLLKKAEAAWASGDFDETARLCHQIRKEQNVPDEVLKRVFVLLGVSEARRGNHEEALSFLKHAKTTRDVLEARIECLYALGYDEELEQVLASPEFAKLPDTRREEILAVVRGHG